MSFEEGGKAAGLAEDCRHEEAAGDTGVEGRTRTPEETLADGSAMAIGAWDLAGEPMDPRYEPEHEAHVSASYGFEDHMGG